MDCNVNFTGRLNIDYMPKNNARWKNIAKIFKEETKGIHYESGIQENNGVLEVYVNRLERKNRKYDCIDDLCSRMAILTKRGTKELLSQPDNVVAKVLARHMQFVKILDDNYKKADDIISKAYTKAYNIFKKNGFDTKSIDEMFESVCTDEIAQRQTASKYYELKKLTGFQDAEISHGYYMG